MCWYSVLTERGALFCRRSFLNEDVLSPALVSVDLLGNKAVELPKGAGAVVSSLIAAKGLQEDPSDGKSKRMQ